MNENECLACGHTVPNDEPVPPACDDAAWDALAAGHAADCEWILTRANLRPDTEQVLPAPGRLSDIAD